MKKALLSILVVACYALPVNAQSVKNGTSVNDYINGVKSLAQQPTEQAYLQFNKDCYNAGDTIYFKAYVLSGTDHQLSKISGVLHVDLINPRDSVMQSLLLHLQNGAAWGDFPLPAYLQAGNYRIRAYTQWMRNQGDSSFFYKTIPVSGNGYTVTQAKNQGKGSIRFYPEAGTFVAGIPVRMAFKVTDANGSGVDAQGVVTDDSGTEVAKFKTSHLGLGHFYVTAKSGKIYRAKLTLKDGTTTFADLPKAEANGMAMAITNTDSAKFSIDVNTTKPYYLQNRDKNITVVMSGGGVLKIVKTALDDQIIGFDMPKKDFPTGLVMVALFGPDDLLVGKRILFVQHQDQPVVNMSHTSTGIDIKSASANNNGSYSVSVVNENKITCNSYDSDDLASNILLTSYLEDGVEQPGYYFDHQTADARNNLDILLLTCKAPVNGKKPSGVYQAETGLQIKGRLTNKKGKALANEKISILTDAGQSAQTTTDNNGMFAFGNTDFIDGSRFLINVENKAQQKDAMITIDRYYNLPPVMPDKSPVITEFKQVPRTSAGANNILANSVVATKASKSSTNLPYHTTSLAGAGNADQVIFMKDLPKAPNLSQALVGIARGVDFANGNAYLRNGAVMANGQTSIPPMMVVVDGAVTGNHNMDIVSMSDVDNIEILKGANAAIYGLGAGSGVIIINTRQGSPDNSLAVSSEMSPGIFSVSPRGYNVPHVSPAGREGNLWQPNLVTDASGNASIDFKGSAPGVYRVAVEGVDNNGHPVSTVYRYTIQ